MSANLISNKTLSNSVIPVKSKTGLIHAFTSSSDFIVPNWYHSLTAILIGGGGAGVNSLSSGFYTFAGGGGGAGAMVAIGLPARPGDKITAVVGAGGAPDNINVTNATIGGSTSIAINDVVYMLVPGGCGGLPGSSGNPRPFNHVYGWGSGGGASEVPGGEYDLPSNGYGYFNSGFFTSIRSFATTGTFVSALNTATFAAAANGGYGSKGGDYNTGFVYTYFAAGGGGAGTDSPGSPANGSSTNSDGGKAVTLLIPTLTGDPIPFFVAGGGGGGCGGGCGDGGFTNYNGVTYTVGGSGANGTANASSGVINTGSGGGGGSAFRQGLAGNGGSGLIILLGQRSYPFSGKPI